MRASCARRRSRIARIFACFPAGYYVTFLREKSCRKLTPQKLDIGVLLSYLCGMLFESRRA